MYIYIIYIIYVLYIYIYIYSGVLFGHVHCLCPWTRHEMSPALFQKHYLSAMVCCGIFILHGVLIFNFFSSLLFQFVCREFSNYDFMARIWNPGRLLRWRLLQKQITTEGPWLFLQKSPSCLTGFLIRLCVGVYDVT